MDITMNLSEVLLYLELMQRNKNKPGLKELNIMLYFLKNYEEVKTFIKKIDDLNFKLPLNFYYGCLIHFIEDYYDCINLRNKFINRARQESIFFIQQILLSKSKEQALEVINEAKLYGVNLHEDWANRCNSMWEIKRDQAVWKEYRESYELNFFPEVYEEFQKMKSGYFESLSLKELKRNLSHKKATKNTHKVSTAVYDRNVFVKEFARRVAKGICQLCENEAPFTDKQGNPFLEIHHIHYLSRGGSDTIDNVVALCPNCHRKVHYLELVEDTKALKAKALANMNI
ncbi:HNH endonuclease [Bacillus sp. FJAT-29814]|uniref:HNH endonuclease n=1 Tax=Bacillus sp. FJAT-29814 TaxID=1729688 RepID=UPI000831458B|nr:HNH endonuclease [Bacillus sp. FJAT-29814]